MLAGPGAAADKKFSWDDDAITSTGRSSPAKHGWSDKGFSSGAEEQKAASKDDDLQSGGSSGKAPMSWDGGIDGSDQKSGRRNAGKAGMGWNDDIDRPAARTAKGNDGGKAPMSWDGGIDGPDQKSGRRNAGKAGTSWGNDTDVPEQKAPAPALPGKRLAMLVIDRDKAGTNVRSAPSGKKTQVIPFRDADEVRTVVLSGKAGKGWFELAPGGLAESGWMHRSVLGICTGGASKGGASAHIGPSADAPSLKIRPGLPLSPLDIRGEWVNVRLGMGKDGSECWIPKEDLLLDDEELSDCAGIWADR